MSIYEVENRLFFSALSLYNLDMDRIMRVLGIAAKWIFIICLPFLLLSASIACAANSLWLYKYGFEKYDVSGTTGLDEPELEKAARGMISYFNSGEQYIDITVMKDGKSFLLFNEREVIHLKDVKGLIRLDYRVLLGTFVYSLVYTLTAIFWHRRRYWRQLAWGVVGGGSITLLLMLALGLATLFDFDRLLLQFHLFSFANDFWQLDPTSDYLIMLFPRGFWYDTTVFLALGTVVAAIILGGVAMGYLWFTRGKASS